MFKFLSVFVVLVMVSACAPALGFKTTNAGTYTLTSAVAKGERVAPIEKNLKAQAHAKCAESHQHFQLVAEHIKHPTGYGPHYTLEFVCVTQPESGN